jgi:hypothetical protein
MTVKEAKEALKTAPNDDSPCKINPALQTKHFHKIMTDCMDSQEEQFGIDHVLRDIFEKRVYQCIRNQRRPRY